jgi:protein TonB
MAVELLNRRNRAIGIAGAVAFNALLLAALLSLSSSASSLRSGPALVSFDVSRPPPPAPPSPDREPAGAAAPPSRGVTRAPSPPKPPRPLPSPTPAQPAVDVGSRSATGAGDTAGSAAGQGGQGSGSGAGVGGSGSGSGAVSPPVHIAGALADADYARADLPRGAAGTVVIGFRVRSDGRVDRCSVVRSSGYDAIDRATCRLVERRFRFRPARDAAGRPIDFQLRTDFTWKPR